MTEGQNIHSGHGELDLPVDKNSETGEPFIDGQVECIRSEIAGHDQETRVDPLSSSSVLARAITREDYDIFSNETGCS